MTPDFWDYRDCFIVAPPEAHTAADELHAAAEALLQGNLALARKMITQADKPALFEHAERLWGKVDQKITRQRDVPNSPKRTRPAKRKKLSILLEREVFARDGWRCRFCGIRVITPRARSAFSRALPDVARWGNTNREKHFGMQALQGVGDHIIPRSRGGEDELKNLVTACAPCNCCRGRWTLDEVGLRDPFSRPPILDNWDGLTRLEKYKVRVSVAGVGR